MSKPLAPVPIKTPVYFTTCPTPLGLMGLAVTPKGLCYVTHQLKDAKQFGETLERTYKRPPEISESKLRPYVREFEKYFAGKLNAFTFPVDFNLGTPFQRKVWRRLKTIPFGETRSYQWLAEAIGQPLACRAVGNANGKNPIPIVVPCHRVIQKNGTLGGYTGGLDLKRYLLDLESPAHGAV